MVLDTVLPLPPRLAAAAAASGSAVPSPSVFVSYVVPHLFGDIQGKVKQLGEKFPIIKRLLANILIPYLHAAALIFYYATSIVPVLTPRLYFKDAYENNQMTIFFT